MPADDLRQAADHIRAGRSAAAQSILMAHLQRNPKSDNAWLLLSYAVADPARKLECVRRALKANPANPQAQKRLAELSSTQRPAPVRPGSPPPVRPETEAAAARPGRTQRATPISQSARPRDMGAAPKPIHRSVMPDRGAALRLRLSLALLIVVLLAILAVALFTVVPWLRQQQEAGQQADATHRAALTPAVITPVIGQSLPPTWTPLPSPSVTPTPTITSTPTSTVTPTPVPPNPTVLAEMDVIEEQVSDLRGLPALAEVPRYLISSVGVKPILESAFFVSGGTREQLEDEARVLSAIGMIKPTYDLYNYALNSLTDSLGGFYFPWSKELFVIGINFSGLERWVFAHEYDHALVDQHFRYADMRVYPLCAESLDRCKAIQALVEGDATLLMDQWFPQYASPQDTMDILRYSYTTPRQTLPEQYPPPYALREAIFPYLEGRTFVEYLFKRGNWTEVNKAYEDLPLSTEQILHPEKYLSGEAPLDVQPAPIGEALGPGWRELRTNTLGEWTTYLLLAYGADLAAQVDEETALRASLGWAGDTYQVFYDDSGAETVLGAHWVWDSSGDANQFLQAMLFHLNERFRGAKLEGDRGDCWEANLQTTCIFRADRETLWLVAPNRTVLDTVLALYPTFR